MTELAPKKAKTSKTDLPFNAAEAGAHPAHDVDVAPPPAAHARPAAASPLPPAAAVVAAPAAAAAAMPCVMLAALRRDSDVRRLLSGDYLSLRELARLPRTCRQWREWLCDPAAGPGIPPVRPPSLPAAQSTSQRGRALRLSWRQWPLVRACGWLRHRVTEVEWSSSYARQRAALTNLLAQLPGVLPHVRKLSLEIDDSPAREEFRSAFTALSGLQLEQLTLHELTSTGWGVLHLFLPYLPLLRRLHTLHLPNARHEPCRLDFSPLSHLPCLTSVCMTADKDHWGDRYEVPAAQAEQLGRCPSLTDLTVGAWSHDENEAGDDPNSLAAFVRGWTEAVEPAEDAQQSSSSSSSTPPTAAPPLQLLDLSDTDVSSSMWPSLCRLANLRALDPRTWCLTDPGEWLALERFTSLERCCICISLSHGDGEHVPLPRMEAILPGLLRCGQLRQCCIALDEAELDEHLPLSAAQLSAMMASWPELRCLELRGVSLESVAPLALASQLAKLWLRGCSGPDCQQAAFRTTLPPMQQLTQLHLDRGSISAEERERLDLQLRRTMPNLQKVT